MSEDEHWGAVARDLRKHMLEAGLNQGQLAELSDVSLSTVRELLGNKAQRRRRPDTLMRLARVLNLHPRHFSYVLHGKTPPASDQAPDDSRMNAVELQLKLLTDKIDNLSNLPDKIDDLNESVSKLRLRIDTVFPQVTRRR